MNVGIEWSKKNGLSHTSIWGWEGKGRHTASSPLHTVMQLKSDEPSHTHWPELGDLTKLMAALYPRWIDGLSTIVFEYVGVTCSKCRFETPARCFVPECRRWLRPEDLKSTCHPFDGHARSQCHRCKNTPCPSCLHARLAVMLVCQGCRGEWHPIHESRRDWICICYGGTGGPTADLFCLDCRVETLPQMKPSMSMDPYFPIKKLKENANSKLAAWEAAMEDYNRRKRRRTDEKNDKLL